MSNEASLRTALNIKNGGLVYQSPITAFQATVVGQNGPTPGCILVSVNGTDVPLTQLTALGGLCFIYNLDTLNWVEYGVWDSVTKVFYPLGQLLPLEGYNLRLSPNLQLDEPGTGTVPGVGTTTLRFKAHNQPCRVLIDAFDP